MVLMIIIKITKPFLLVKVQLLVPECVTAFLPIFPLLRIGRFLCLSGFVCSGGFGSFSGYGGIPRAPHIWLERWSRACESVSEQEFRKTRFLVRSQTHSARLCLQGSGVALRRVTVLSLVLFLVVLVAAIDLNAT